MTTVKQGFTGQAQEEQEWHEKTKESDKSDPYLILFTNDQFTPHKMPAGFL